jgi:hypothetical protein
MSDKNLLPDIKAGVVIHDFRKTDNDAINIWMTEIQGILYNSNTAFVLSHECLSETLNPQRILKDKRQKMISILTVEDQKVIVDIIRPGYYFNPNLLESSSAYAKKHRTRDISSRSSYNAPMRQVVYLEFEQLLAEVMAGAVDIRNLFVQYTLDQIEGGPYTLLTPARYLNFRSNTEAKDNYLQPISGLVPMVHKGEVNFGYIVSHLKNGETLKIECGLNEDIDLLKALSFSPMFKPRDGSLKQRAKPWIKWLYGCFLYPLRNIYHNSVYSKTVFLNGSCRFYRYV